MDELGCSGREGSSCFTIKQFEYQKAYAFFQIEKRERESYDDKHLDNNTCTYIHIKHSHLIFNFSNTAGDTRGRELHTIRELLSSVFSDVVDFVYVS